MRLAACVGQFRGGSGIGRERRLEGGGVEGGGDCRARGMVMPKSVGRGGKSSQGSAPPLRCTFVFLCSNERYCTGNLRILCLSRASLPSQCSPTVATEYLSDSIYLKRVWVGHGLFAYSYRRLACIPPVSSITITPLSACRRKHVPVVDDEDLEGRPVDEVPDLENDARNYADDLENDFDLGHYDSTMVRGKGEGNVFLVFGVRMNI